LDIQLRERLRTSELVEANGIGKERTRECILSHEAMRCIGYSYNMIEPCPAWIEEFKYHGELRYISPT